MKLPHRRQFLHLAAGAAVLPAVSRTARAQAYPSRPIRLIIGYAPGGSTDITARVIAQWLSERLGQQVIVESKPGGGTNIAVQSVVNSPADGYTLLFYTASNAINMSFYEALPFNLLRDIAPIAGLVSMPNIMEVNQAVPAKTVAEFIAYAKANPGKVNMASYGTGTTGHLAGELLKMMTGINLTHVPYRGEAPALTDLIGGQVQVLFGTPPASLPHVKAGSVRALAVTTTDRLAALPDLPTVAETISSFDAGTWFAIGAPRGTPPEIIERLNREINAGLAQPSIRTRFAELGTTPMVMTPAELGRLTASDADKWAKVVKSAGVKAE